jgi:hypothetical protein
MRDVSDHPLLNALREHHAAADRLSLAKDGLKEAKLALEEEACRAVVDASPQEISDMYWRLPDVSGRKMAAALGVSFHDYLRDYVRPTTVDLTCFGRRGECRREITVEVASRARRDEAMKSKFARCDRCVAESAAGAASWEDLERARAEKVDALRRMPYADYLRTDHWQFIRKAALRRAQYRCQVCYADGLLDVHHRTYENRGRESYADVTVLCRTCHSLFHERQTAP